MVYKSFRFQLIGRLTLLLLTMFLFTHLYYSETYFFTKFLVFCLGLFQIWYLYNFLEKSNREIVHFLESIHYDDFTNTYPERKSGSSRDSLYHEFNEILKKFREIRADKEAQHQYLRTIVQHIGIGIITFDSDGEVQIMNNAAKKLLGLKLIKNINQIGREQPGLLESTKELRTGGRDLIKITKNEDEVQLAVYAIELSLRGKAFKLISIQNIQSELEEKEMEAWQNLIRVLTHEIMNSVTPISSLAATVETELAEFLKNGMNINQIKDDTIEDFYLSVKTIHNRSESLIKFVSDFRNMTRIKLPNLETNDVEEMIKHVLVLLKPDIEQSKIKVNCSVKPGLTVNIDREQIEQVIINVVKNAIQALAADDKENKSLTITAMPLDGGGAFISVADNGTGIEEEALKKIFIPFFTTKKNGSGIGLSLSKQIMRKHGGNITAKSQIGEGTEFLLKFAS
ncbi:MAG: ATP-binding protein [Ekhidna sp.]|uniref:sensor histidine kinase n=1 Tax=Ekhidna sp. TaxID=2608089 RepID=UPI00329916AF